MLSVKECADLGHGDWGWGQDRTECPECGQRHVFRVCGGCGTPDDDAADCAAAIAAAGSGFGTGRWVVVNASTRPTGTGAGAGGVFFRVEPRGVSDRAERGLVQLRALVAHLEGHPELEAVSIQPAGLVAGGLCEVYGRHGVRSACAWARSFPAPTLTLRRDTAVLVQIDAAPFRVLVLFDDDQVWALAQRFQLRRRGDVQSVTVDELVACLDLDPAEPDDGVAVAGHPGGGVR